MPKINLTIQSKKTVRRINRLTRQYRLVMIQAMAKGIGDTFNRASTKFILPKKGTGIYYTDRVGQIRTRGDAFFDPNKLTGRTGKLQRALGEGKLKLSDWKIPKSGRSGKLEGGSPFIEARIKGAKGTAVIDYEAKFGIRAKGDRGMRFRIAHEFGIKRRFGTGRPRPFLNPAAEEQDLLYERIYKRFSKSLRNIVV